MTEGASAVDESMVTGESMPVEKVAAATKVIGGTINGTGTLVMIAEKIGADTMLSLASCTWLPKPSAAEPPSNVSLTSLPPGLFRRS